MKCKVCHIEIESGQSYSCVSPGLCDFGNNGWILVETDLPKDDNNVMCYDKKYDEIFEGYYDEKEGLWWKSRESWLTDDRPEMHVSHWMPKPNKPIF